MEPPQLTSSVWFIAQKYFTSKQQALSISSLAFKFISSNRSQETVFVSNAGCCLASIQI